MNTYTLTKEQVKELNRTSLNDLIRQATGKILLTTYRVR